MSRYTLLLALCFATTASAQSPLPDPHWGANIFPLTTPEVRAGLYFNRFTEFDGSGDRFNEIDETAGINFLMASYTDRFAAYPDLSFSVHAGIGVTSDEPTRFFQNDFVHELLGLDEVEVDGSREETEFVGGFSLTRSFADANNLDWFAGGGLAAGTLYSEPYLHAGGYYFSESRRVRLGLLVRGSTPVGGDAYPDVASFSTIVQTSLAYVPNRIDSENWFMRSIGNPEIGVTLSWDSGLFEDRRGDSIDTLFTSLHVRWATGLAFETWNDTLNNTDFGPTFGFMISFDLATFLRLNI